MPAKRMHDKVSRGACPERSHPPMPNSRSPGAKKEEQEKQSKKLSSTSV
jgi:hypothetical protein